MSESDAITTAERTVLRELAKRAAEIAVSPAMEARRARWKHHNDLRSTYPIIWASPEGSWRELLTDEVLCCQSAAARGCEVELRRAIFAFDHFHDDGTIDPYWVVDKAVRNSGWGMEEKWAHTGDPTGARGFCPQIFRPDDLKKLHPPVITHDEAATQRNLEQAQNLFGDLFPVRLQGVVNVSFHLMKIYTGLRGLEQVMMDMLDNPGWLHEAMAFLEQGCHGIVRQYVEQNLLGLNNDNAYHASGGRGYTDQLPAAGFDPARVRPCDVWASAEAQEMAQVSPAMHREFALDYEKRLLAPFGLNGYGCCEDLTRKMDDVLTIPNIRRISISPWANVEKCAEKLGGRYIFSWKPHPAHLAGRFDGEAIRRYIRRTLDVCKAHGCVLEMILKDTHTCDNHPERFTEWTRIAREEVTQVHGEPPAA